MSAAGAPSPIDSPRRSPSASGGERVIAHTTARTRRERRRPRITLNLTAMIDVTFLLLVYFMVATEFKLGEEVYRLDLPERLSSTAASDPFELDEEPLRIRVATIAAAAGSYRLQVEGPYTQPRSFEELHEFLRRRQINDVDTTGLFEPDHPIIIEPTPTTTWQHAMEAFNAAARARYTNVTMGQSSS